VSDRDLEKYRNSSQQRLLRVLLHLGGHEVLGLSAVEIARSLGISAPNVHRDLANLRLAGIAEQDPDTARWRLSPRVTQIAVAMMRALDRAEARIAEARQRHTREPR